MGWRDRATARSVCLSGQEKPMTSGKMSSIAALIAAAAVAAALSPPWTALGQSATTSDPTDAGKAVVKQANCFGVHKGHGNGGGGLGVGSVAVRHAAP